MTIDIKSLVEALPQRLPVFPLKGAVLLPGSVLPLHIFEPRYRTMVQDVLDGDRLLAVGFLMDCSTEEYESEPPFREIVCVGHLVHHEPMPDGRSNIALLGVTAGVATRVLDDRPYRTAMVAARPDHLDPSVDCAEMITRAFKSTVSDGSDIEALKTQIGPLVGQEGLSAALINTCALNSTIKPWHKQELLEEPDMLKRLEMLLQFLERRWQWN
ncbi:MAG: LON peptidase substrate-binding domain-containing protein [Planctomycetota bacterium]|nr:LON peptidase substrate-binding domain-containing protein [Planctomycetota bacterium]